MADRFAGKRHRIASPLSKSLNAIRKCDENSRPKTLGRCKRKVHRKAHDLDDGVAEWDTCDLWTGQPPFRFSKNCASFPAARWLLSKIFSMITMLFVILGAWMLLSLVFCLALCVAASKPAPEFEASEESFEISQQHAHHEHVMCVKGFSSPALPAKRPSDTRFFPSTLTNA